MKRLLFAFILIFGFNTVCIATCPEQIKTFYSAYLTNVLHDASKNEALCKTYLTEELLAKVQRVANATGVDPIIRAQDANKDAIETLEVDKLIGDWYVVRYLWNKRDSSTSTEIPLKVRNIDGNCQISYITPIWNGSQYGDELLSGKCSETHEVNQSSELSFLESFYKTYVAVYCTMPKNMNERLASMRSNYLSKSALEQFENAEADNVKDGLAGYDLVIDNFDYDCAWCKSLEFKHLNGSCYRIAYRVGNKDYKFIVTIKKSGNTYLIDGFNVCEFGHLSFQISPTIMLFEECFLQVS